MGRTSSGSHVMPRFLPPTIPSGSLIGLLLFDRARLPPSQALTPFWGRDRRPYTVHGVRGRNGGRSLVHVASAGMRPLALIARTSLGDLAVDLTGIGFVAVGVWWGTRVARTVGGDASALVMFGAAAVAAYLLARAAGEVAKWLPPALIVLGTALLTIVPTPTAGTYPSGLRFGPLAYANASAALYLLAAGAGLTLARLTRTRPGRWFGVMAALTASVAVLMSGSVATTALLALLVVAVPVRGRRPTRVLLAGFAVTLLLVAAASWGLASRYRSDPEGAVMQTASDVLSPERLVYWSEALVLAERHPDTGVGPGRFRQLAPSASGNVDAVAVHNDYLQAAAELGIPGVLLLVTLFGWGFVRLARSAAAPASALVGAGLAAVGLHATVDYALHAPAVVIALAMLLGTGAGRLDQEVTGS